MFLIFAGSHDEGGTLGGWLDYQGRAYSFDDALAAAAYIQEKNDWVEWWHIVDVATLSVIASNNEYIFLDFV
jgi:hypothetical protein